MIVFGLIGLVIILTIACIVLLNEVGKEWKRANTAEQRIDVVVTAHETLENGLIEQLQQALKENGVNSLKIRRLQEQLAGRRKR